MTTTVQSRRSGVGIVILGIILLLGHTLFYQSRGVAFPKAAGIATFAIILGIGWTIEAPPIPNQHPSRWCWGYIIVALIVGIAYGMWWYF